MAATTFAIISDVHLGKDNIRPGSSTGTFGSKGPALLRRFSQEMKRFRPDFIVSLGDNIADSGSIVKDIANTRRYAKLVRQPGIPVHFVMGNHDVHFLSDAQLKQALSVKRLYYTFDAGPVMCIVLYTYSRGGKQDIVLIPKPQLQWLKRTLQKASKPVIVFNHHPLDEQSVKGNPYEDYWRMYPKRGKVANRAAVRRILERSGKIIAVFTGHFHWQNKKVHHSIPYYSIPSLTQNTRGKPERKWAEVSVQKGKVTARMQKLQTVRVPVSPLPSLSQSARGAGTARNCESPAEFHR